MLIYFKKVKVYVPIEMLFRYIRWVSKLAWADRSIRYFLRCVWSPVWLRKVPINISETMALAKSLGLDNGWIRWDTDGSRRQVFDPLRGGICKISKQGAALDISDEIELRKPLGDLSPRIIKHDPTKKAYVEEWIDVSPGNCPIEKLECVRRVLDERLYRIEERGIDSYINNSTIAFSDEGRNIIPDLVRQLKRTSMPISQVHGDLVCANIAIKKNGEPIVYDWEYSRTCVVTQDVWFFLYHRATSKGGGLDLTSFLKEFQNIVGWAFPMMHDICSLHLIHLFEREALLMRNSEFVDSDYALKRLRESINDALMSINLSL